MRLSDLVSVIKDWTPPPLKTEREYQTSLYEHLKKRLPEDSIVQKEYPHAGMMVDLYVRLKVFLWAWEVFIELKRNLTTSECDRLVGQIHRLGPTRKIIIVLLGGVGSALVGRLKEEFAIHLSKGAVMWAEPSMFIVSEEP
jgi:hypothetical protein